MGRAARRDRNRNAGRRAHRRRARNLRVRGRRRHRSVHAAAANAAPGRPRSPPASTFACRARTSPIFRALRCACTACRCRRDRRAGAGRVLPRRARHDAGIRLRGCTRIVPHPAPRAGARRHREQAAMTRSELARLLDHSILKPEATGHDVRAGADVVRAGRIGFYCVQPCWVELAAQRTRWHGCQGGQRGRLSARLRTVGGKSERSGARRGRRRRRDRHGAEFRRAEEWPTRRRLRRTSPPWFAPYPVSRSR